MTTFGIRIDNKFVPVARKDRNGYTILNPLVLLVANHVQLENDNISRDIITVGDLNKALSKQYVDKRAIDILREDELTNELE